MKLEVRLSPDFQFRDDLEYRLEYRSQPKKAALPESRVLCRRLPFRSGKWEALRRVTYERHPGTLVYEGEAPGHLVSVRQLETILRYAFTGGGSPAATPNAQDLFQALGGVLAHKAPWAVGDPARVALGLNVLSPLEKAEAACRALAEALLDPELRQLHLDLWSCVEQAGANGALAQQLRWFLRNPDLEEALAATSWARKQLAPADCAAQQLLDQALRQVASWVPACAMDAQTAQLVWLAGLGARLRLLAAQGSAQSLEMLTRQVLAHAHPDRLDRLFLHCWGTTHVNWDERSLPALAPRYFDASTLALIQADPDYFGIPPF